MPETGSTPISGTGEYIRPVPSSFPSVVYGQLRGKATATTLSDARPRTYDARYAGITILDQSGPGPIAAPSAAGHSPRGVYQRYCRCRRS